MKISWFKSTPGGVYTHGAVGLGLPQRGQTTQKGFVKNAKIFTRKGVQRDSDRFFCEMYSYPSFTLSSLLANKTGYSRASHCDISAKKKRHHVQAA